jgi:Leucine Rich repeats (2 copies)
MELLQDILQGSQA